MRRGLSTKLSTILSTGGPPGGQQPAQRWKASAHHPPKADDGLRIHLEHHCGVARNAVLDLLPGPVPPFLAAIEGRLLTLAVLETVKGADQDVRTLVMARGPEGHHVDAMTAEHGNRFAENQPMELGAGSRLEAVAPNLDESVQERVWSTTALAGSGGRTPRPADR